MTLWLVRAGQHGEYERKFLDEKRIYLTWDFLSTDLNEIKTRDTLKHLLRNTYSDASEGQIRNNSGQIWAFAKTMQIGDWVILPSKHKPAVHVGEIIGEYQFDRSAENPYFHYRNIKWIAHDLPRTNFDQDILYSFNALMTICKIERNDAERRVRAMKTTEWKATSSTAYRKKGADDLDDELQDNTTEIDLAEIARDQVAKLIIARFKGHGLARLIASVLRAQGYVTLVSPEGADGGIDILAAPAPMGFGEPRICVQVKSGDSPLPRETLDNLIGVMMKVNATSGLLVSWGGFKSSVDREKSREFFKVRLWDQGDIIDQICNYYDKLEDEIQAELPLQRVWIVA